MGSTKIDPVIWARWQKKQQAMLNGPRWKEHNREETMTYKRWEDHKEVEHEMRYRRLELELNSPLLDKHIESPDRNSPKVSRLDKRAAEIMGFYTSRGNKSSEPGDFYTNILKTAQTMKYTFDRIPPASVTKPGLPLYIALHGGGAPGNTGQSVESSTLSNDNAWIDMAKYLYSNAVEEGIWVAVRGINEYWDLHFSPASYVLIERLIENMILFEGVDSNRVYVIGFSAGGDGVWRLAPHLSQRFAASNMGGGDPGDTDNYFANLINSPICLQVGAWDDNKTDRCKNVGKMGEKLDKIQDEYERLPGDTTKVYDHKTYIHITPRHDPKPNPSTAGDDDPDYGFKHNSWDDVSSSWRGGEAEKQRSEIVSDYKKWWPQYATISKSVDQKVVDKYIADMTEFLNRNKTTANTNAVEWVKRHAREPKSLNMVWNTEIRAPASNDNFSLETLWAMSAPSQNYWLDIGPDPADKMGSKIKVRTAAEVGSEIRVRIDKPSRIIFVDGAKSYLRIFLHPDMLDLSRWISVRIGGQRIPVAVGTTPNIAVIDYTLARNDPHLAYTADIVLRQDGLGKWTAAPTPLTSW